MAETAVSERVYDAVRGEFPYFASTENPVFFENAGGSQLPLCVINAVRDYMQHSYVQLTAPYPLSQRATAVVARAHDTIKTLMNAEGVGEVVLGSSTSQLLANLGDSYSRVLLPGDEVVVQESCHEANLGPWVRAVARSGATLRWWGVDDAQGGCSLAALDQLLGPRTRLVAATHVSNLLGAVLDVADLCARVRARSPAARVVVDGVAYAPHAAMDMRAWGVDWYIYSTYKVYGPHAAALYGRHDAFTELTEQGGEGLNHFWIPADDVPYKFELGGPSHEACAGLNALAVYLSAVVKHHRVDQLNNEAGHQAAQDATNGTVTDAASALSRDLVEAAMEVFHELEAPLVARLTQYLSSHPRVRLLGPTGASREGRVPTFSFLPVGSAPSAVVKQLVARGFALRHGHMYAYRLVQALARWHPDLTTDEGVVRLSLVHYNTPQEVERLLAALDEVL